jgi:hypothetical protein
MINPKAWVETALHAIGQKQRYEPPSSLSDLAKNRDFLEYNVAETTPDRI